MCACVRAFASYLSLEPGLAAADLRAAESTLVAERMMMASHSARAPALSSSLVSFFLTTCEGRDTRTRSVALSTLCDHIWS